MTTPSTERKAGPLLGTGAQTTWPFTFKVFAATDIAVTIANSLGVETALVYGVDYTVILNANQETSPGGTVTYPIAGSALPAGSTLTIVGDLDYDQPLDLPSGGNFSPLALENQLDRTVMQLQQLKEQVGRSVKAPVSDASVDMTMPAAAERANRYLSFDLTGRPVATTFDIDAVQNASTAAVAAAAAAAGSESAAASSEAIASQAAATVASVVASVTPTVVRFSGDGVETDFTLPSTPGAEENTLVFISGVYQQKDQYSVTGTTLAFTSAPPLGVDNVEVQIGPAVQLSVASALTTSYQPPGTGAVATNVQSKLRESVSVKDFGAVGDYTTDDTTAVLAAIAAVGQGGVVHFPRGVYRVTQSIDLPMGVKIVGDGAPNMQPVPIFDDDKRYLRPGFKHLIPGSSIVFSGSATKTTTMPFRSDRFASFTYAIKTYLDHPNDIRGLGLIMDMDVFTAGGALTTITTDNKSNYDVGLLVDDSHHCKFEDVTVFGYWSKASLVVASRGDDPLTFSDNPDYNYFHLCNFTGDIGVALVGHQVYDAGGIGEGLSGTTFVQCCIHDRTHHDRDALPANPSFRGTNVIFIDGATKANTVLAGHKFIGCSLRGTVSNPINLDQADDLALIGCTTEFTGSPQNYIVGTSRTRRITISGTRMFGSSEAMETLASTILGPLVLDEDDDGQSYIIKSGKGICIGPADEVSNDPLIQLTTDFSSATRGWNIRYSTGTGNLDINFDNTLKARFDSSGNITPGGRLKRILGATTRQAKTIAAGAITVDATSSYLSIATEGGAASDDLDIINGGEIGDILIVTAFSGSATVVMKDGTGNLRLAGDFSLDNSDDTITLMKNVSGNWVEVCRSDNGA